MKKSHYNSLHTDLMISTNSVNLQLLLSSSMDKTVRLWDMETKSCLKLFAHNDYGQMPNHVATVFNLDLRTKCDVP